MVSAVRSLNLPEVGARLRAGWCNTPRSLLHKSLLVFLAADFVLSPEPLWADLFYVVLIPLMVRTVWHALTRAHPPHASLLKVGLRPALMQYWQSLPRATQLGVALLVWVALSLVWDTKAHAHPMVLVSWVFNVVFTLAFVLSLSDALCHGPGFRERLGTVLIGAGLVNLAITFTRLPFFLPTFWSGNQLRITGWGATRHQIIGAIIIGFVVLLAFNRVCQSKTEKGSALPAATGHRVGQRQLWFCALMASAGLLFMGLTGSRGPEIAIAVTLPVFLVWVNPRIAVLLLGAGVSVLALLAMADYSALHRIWLATMERGDSSRFAIWHMSWAAIQQHPLLGHGPTYLLPRIHNESFPHNLFLSTWVYTGVVGLGLLVASMLAAAYQAGRANTRQRPLAVCCLLYLTLCGLTDLSQIARGPSLIWYIFWLPVLFAASLPPAARAGSAKELSLK